MEPISRQGLAVVVLSVLAASSASAAFEPAELVSRMREFRPMRPPPPEHLRGVGKFCPAPSAGQADAPGGADCAVPASSFFAFGAGARTAPASAVPALHRPPAPAAVRPRGAVLPVNMGFRALGPAGSRGSVDGPGRQGNGTFTVERNDPFEVRMTVRTGYADGSTTLSRDPATGKDLMRFVGKVWDMNAGGWGGHHDVTAEVSISYDSRADRGKIRWQENGRWKEEGYWGGGKPGSRRMTIELGGGWDHDFTRD